MLTDITLGQYFPGNSFIHKLDPRTKLLATLIYIIAIFFAVTPLAYGILSCLCSCGDSYFKSTVDGWSSNL